MTEPNGILIVNKHSGVTSHDIVGKVRRLFGTKRVGHTGTLDPMASGVLVVLVGRAAKAAEYLVAETKQYRATLRLGLTTDTEDTTGQILSRCDSLPSKEDVKKACLRSIGDIQQVPPMYSALKVNGKKLCDLARQGVEVQRASRNVTIFSLDCFPTDKESDYILDVFCSSGTYIRTLCADLGKVLGCGGVMASLERRKAGDFTLEQSHTIDELEQMTIEERWDRLIPTESLFASLPEVCLPEFYERLCRSGCEIYQKKLRVDLPIGQRVRLASHKGDFFALGEVREYPEGSAIKSLKLFDLG
ncbi:MAG: tRNA pseudouridine(55) synthase TruB [Clostridia bacterium]|nr:tRNA pseudouridine(55) synthase TruB [Clostridia bacterium]